MDERSRDPNDGGGRVKMKAEPGAATLGINGLGRIGKLLLWHHVARNDFSRLVVNVGREVGTNLEAVCDVIERDSTYGPMHRFLFGVNAAPCVRVADRQAGLLDVGGTAVTILFAARNPRDIAWHEHGVRVVVDATGAFDDPTLSADHPTGALRGHIVAGAAKVIYSAAFKIRDRRLSTPDDAVTIIVGINEDAFDPAHHDLISAASCTTTALAHMIRPLVDRFSAGSLLTASMSTVHAATNSQSVLDTLPAAGATDLRRSRSVLNNIILTSTNAAEALEEVIPEIGTVGFMADSVRIPVPTESLLILNVTMRSALTLDGRSDVTREGLNATYADASVGAQRGYLVFSDRQNVSADVKGMRAAVVIEGVETHTRTGFVTIDLATVPALTDLGASITSQHLDIPVTHAKIFGWYDNEYGSYTNMLGDLSVHVHQSLD
jgi:glyceraldehyde 3-phosphate dehydrogenase